MQNSFNFIFFVVVTIVLSIAAAWCLRRPKPSRKQELEKRYRLLYDTRLGILRVLCRHSPGSRIYDDERRLGMLRGSLRSSMANCLAGYPTHLHEHQFCEEGEQSVEKLFYQILNDDANYIRQTTNVVYYQLRELNIALNPRKL